MLYERVYSFITNAICFKQKRKEQKEQNFKKPSSKEKER